MLPYLSCKTTSYLVLKIISFVCTCYIENIDSGLTSWVPGLLCYPVPCHIGQNKRVLGRATIFHVNYLCPQVMGPHLATNLTWVGVRLYRGSTPRSGQGHVKVIWRSNQLKYSIKKTYFTVFCCKWVFHKAAVDIFWLGSLPTLILGGTVTICGLEG